MKQNDTLDTTIQRKNCQIMDQKEPHWHQFRDKAAKLGHDRQSKWHMPREGTPILGHGREVLQRWPPFFRFTIWLGPYFMPHHHLIDPLFLQKTNCLSHLLPEICGPKVDLIFHQNVLFISFEAFCMKFHLDFHPIDPHLSLVLDIFDPSFSQNIRSDWYHFLLYGEPHNQHFVKYL